VLDWDFEIHGAFDAKIERGATVGFMMCAWRFHHYQDRLKCWWEWDRSPIQRSIEDVAQ